MTHSTDESATTQIDEEEEGDWDEEVDGFLEEPELITNSKTVNGDFTTTTAVQVHHDSKLARKQERYQSDQLQFITAALIEMLAQFAGDAKMETVRRSLTKMIISTGNISAIHFSEEYKHFRMAITDIIRNIIVNESGLYSNPFVDQGLSISKNVASRYHREYKELDEIGSGGFGKVFKVKCYLDQQIYAAKKIKVKKALSEKLSLEAVLNEVRILASLNHPGIVRYHIAWFELDEIGFIDSLSNDSTFEDHADITEIEGSDEDQGSAVNDSQLSWATTPPNSPTCRRPISKFYQSGDASSSSSGSDDDAGEPIRICRMVIRRPGRITCLKGASGALVAGKDRWLLFLSLKW
ncbi:hypothetical protein L596_029780 [Steinernema carpocapsae]|uniref:Protein kinase domain-containing protein n=1 Tax=Steinernema carpocapsae TaxID=34508 RepID=A0A4U5LQT4_STECR|nr:hypothetical protein L596_029780 [Steinernema carpocapsae]